MVVLVACAILRRWALALRRVSSLKRLRESGGSVLITGAAGGVGRALSRAFAKRNVRLLLWDLDENGLAITAKEARELKATDVKTFTVNLADRTDVKRVAEEVRNSAGFEFVEVLINNAGIVSGAPFLQIPEEKIELTMKVNTLAHFWTARAFLPEMLKRRQGHIVAIASAAGLLGSPRMVDYCASKFGAVGFFEALRLELKKTGVSSTLVCPAHINTELFKGFRVPFVPSLQPDDLAEEILDAVLCRRTYLLRPFVVRAGLIMKTLSPLWMSDMMNDLSKVNMAMNTFQSDHADAKFRRMSV